MTAKPSQPSQNEEQDRDLAVDAPLSPADVDILDEATNEVLPLEDVQEDPDDVIAEDDDNPYEESDEALPDDREEKSIARDISREGGRFDEV